MKCPALSLLKDKDLWTEIVGTTGTVGIIWHQIDTKNIEAIAGLNRGGTALQLRQCRFSLPSRRKGFADLSLLAGKAFSFSRAWSRFSVFVRFLSTLCGNGIHSIHSFCAVQHTIRRTGQQMLQKPYQRPAYAYGAYEE
jgi:hypothetical protein